MTYAFIHAVKFFILTAVLGISFFLFTNGSVHAYFTTAQDATIIDGSSLLFTIEYQFGHKKRDVHMPVRAHNTETGFDTAVSYTILNQDGEQVAGKAMGIVFSNAKLTNEGEYVVPKTEAKKFTLTVLFTPTISVQGEEYRLQVNHLPFTFDGEQQLQLNPSELTYYTTKYTSF